MDQACGTTVVSFEADYYRIPLPAAVSDSMHGEMTVFELNTVRLRDRDGAEGVGYTYTCGRNGAAIDAVLTRDMAPLVIDEGFAVCPSRPGHGIAFDWQGLEALRG